MTSLADSRTSAGAPFGPEQAREVVHSLRATFAAGRTRPVDWRLEQLRGITRLLSERESEIAAALAADLERSPHDSWFGDVAPTLSEAEFAIKHLRKWVKPNRVSVPLALMGGRATYRYEPLGVVLVIAPWNYPWYLSLGPMVGALAAGNCVVLKPSEHAPASSAAMADLIPRYLDPEAVRVVEGEATATRELIDARMDYVFFTGGTEIGRKVMEAAARHLTPVTLELGGKSPAVVTRDANVEVAARRIAFGKLLNSGQTCVAPDYVLVDEAVKDRLVEGLRSNLARMQAGAPAEQPIVDERHFKRLSALVDQVRDRIAAGGGTRETALEPTIVVDPPADSAVMKEEIFGPILPVLGVGSLDEAISFVNSREKPLAAYIFSENHADHERFFEQVPAGGAVANQTLMHLLAPGLPFGGVGQSGMGAYHGKWGYETFSHRKATLVMRSRPDLKFIYPPYSEWAKKLLRKLA